MHLDVDALGEMLAGIVEEHVAKAVQPLNARIAELEGRPTIDIVIERCGELLDGIVAALPQPKDGVSPDPEDIAAAFVPAAQELIASEVAKQVAALPPPERGEPGRDADPIDPAAVKEMVEVAVAQVVEALPKPKDGEPGKDAAGIVEALKDSGELVLTLQDGRLVRTGIRDGKKGKDGRDGFGFDDMDVAVLDDDRTIELSFRRGGEEKVFTLKWPTMIDRGVYKAGEQYEAGDAVTWGGSLWTAQRATSAKPDTPESGWRLAVKRGRDGKDKQ
jgi:hypothetical protein